MATHATAASPALLQPARTWLRRAMRALSSLHRIVHDAWRELASPPAADPLSVQRILVEVGRLEPQYVTGTTNPQTLRALAGFQRERGLRSDGIADAGTVHELALTWHAMSEIASDDDGCDDTDDDAGIIDTHVRHRSDGADRLRQTWPHTSIPPQHEDDPAGTCAVPAGP